jgi:hypothetical protein
MVGFEGHHQIVARVLDEVDALPNVRVWCHQFSAVIPRTERAQLVIDGGSSSGAHRVYPVWPASVRLNTTPAEGIAGRLVYVGKGSIAEVPPRGLRGQIAVMELASGEGWRRAAQAGAAAVLLLDSDEVTQQDAAEHFLRLPVSVPRFCVPQGSLADVLRRSGKVTGRLLCKASWVEVQATNIYALVRPAKGAPLCKALAIAAPLDSAGVAPALAPGADAAVDAAMALTALRHFAEDPPARPLLFAFLDAQAICQLGVRQMLGALAVPQEEREESLKKEQRTRRKYQKAHDLLLELEQSGDALSGLHMSRYKDLQRYVKDEVDQDVVVIDAELQTLRLKAVDAEGEEKEQILPRIEKLVADRSRLHAARTQMLTGRTARPNLSALADSLWRRARARIWAQMRDSESVFQRAKARDRLRQEVMEELGLEPDDSPQGPIAFLLGLDLSDGGAAAGPSRFCHFLRKDETVNSTALKSWIRAATTGDGDSIWPDSEMAAVNLAPFEGLATADAQTVGYVGTLTSPASGFAVPAVTWATLDAPRPRVDTPGDRAENLDWSRLDPQIRATFTLLRALASDPSFAEDASPVSTRWSRVRGVVLDVSPGIPVPRLPMVGYIVTLATGYARPEQVVLHPYYKPVPGIRRLEFRFTGSDGRFLFEFLPVSNLVHRSPSWCNVCMQAYKLAEDGRIVRAIDYRRTGRGVRLSTTIRDGYKTNGLRGVAFTCQEISVLGLRDARFLLPLAAVGLFDARSLSTPKRSNVTIHDGMLSCQLEPDVRWQAVYRAGITRNRMALLNMADPKQNPHLDVRELGRGFPMGRPLPLDPVYQAARDWFRLDGQRLAEYRRAGITSEPVNALRKRTAYLLAEADGALQRDDGAAFERAVGAAMANEFRAYHAVLDTASDVVRGAVFLLLVLVPFAYAMERLLVASPRIYRQIIGMALFFAIMTAVLWSFHPAFKISSQPLTVIMAFGIIFMSLLVTSMVYRKFSSELEKVRSGRAEESGAKTSRLGVLTTALRLGIANMRKRKLRTALTGLTVVLITFALLCFVSTSRYFGSREYVLDAKARFTGVLVRHVGPLAIPDAAVAQIQNTLERRQDIVPRRWWVRPEPNWRLYARNPAGGQQVEFRAALGLVGDEAKVTAVAEVCPNWKRFAAGGGCYMDREHARELEVEPGDPLVVAGQRLELIGVFDGPQFDRTVLDLNGRPMTPADFAALSTSEINDIRGTSLDRLARQQETGSGLDPDEGLVQLPSASVIILPAAMLHKGLRYCDLRRLAVAARDGTEAQTIARKLAERFAFMVFYGTRGDNVRVLASSPLLPTAPTSLIIPLAIGGLIIFNTMLSSIAERRREIYVYTSIGLAPIHVAFLFLAEAMTYGLMGSIFGYVVGQALATALSHLGWLGGLTLNYSGGRAVLIMLMVLGVVMVSSLVPAYLAGRLAAPGTDRTWHVPSPVGDMISDALPFTVTSKAANGVAAFLYEYLDAHREGSIGRFGTDDLRAFRTETEGLSALGIEATVWLTPYDLGIHQQIRLVIRATADEDVYAIHIELRRASGPVGTWHKLNHVFLGDLRRQLLGWRKLTAERVLRYLSEGERVLAAAT